jgi:hypothetical protein
VALPYWKVLLLNRATMQKIGEFTQFSSASYSKRLNSAGSASISCSLEDPVSQAIVPLATVLAFERNGHIVWSGPIINRDDSLPNRSVSAQAVGFFDVLMKRVFRQNRTAFTNVDAGQIAQAIISEANAQSPTGITITSIDTTVPRTRTYSRFSSMGQAIVELSQVENGFDFEVVGTEFRVYANQGVDRSASAAAGVDQVVLGVQAATQNVATFSRKIDTSSFTNRVAAITTGSIEVVEDTDSVTQYGLYEVSQSLGPVSSDVGRAYAAAEVAVRGLPIETITVSLLPTDEDERVPRFDGNGNDDDSYFGLGDKLRVVVQDPDLPLIDQAFRVFGATVSLDANGVERLSDLQLAAPLRTNISTTGMVFRDTGGLYTATNAGNPDTTITVAGDGYTVLSIPYVNVSTTSSWIVGDAVYSILGLTTVLD